MLFGRSCSTILTVAALTASALAAQTTTTSGTLTRATSTPPVGLGSTETAQINVTNLASNSSSGTAASCTGTVSFINASGTVIGSATSFTVTAGQTSSVTLPFTKAGASGIRTEVRGVVSLTLTTGSGAAPCSLASSLETYDASTGATHAFLALGEPTGGPIGFGRP